jgi:hypothetical protein
MSYHKISPVLKERTKLIALPGFSFFHSSYELQLYVACPSDPTQPCTPDDTETKYTGPEQRASLAGLQPYTTYKLRVVAHNEVGSMSSEWISFITQKEREYKKLLP